MCVFLCVIALYMCKLFAAPIEAISEMSQCRVASLLFMQNLQFIKENRLWVAIYQSVQCEVIIWLVQVYRDTSNVDDYLIQSIIKPAEDPNAGEVYYRYHAFKFFRGKFITVCLPSAPSLIQSIFCFIKLALRQFIICNIVI